MIVSEKFWMCVALIVSKDEWGYSVMNASSSLHYTNSNSLLSQTAIESENYLRD